MWWPLSSDYLHGLLFQVRAGEKEKKCESSRARSRSLDKSKDAAAQIKLEPHLFYALAELIT